MGPEPGPQGGAVNGTPHPHYAFSINGQAPDPVSNPSGVSRFYRDWSSPRILTKSWRYTNDLHCFVRIMENFST